MINVHIENLGSSEVNRNLSVKLAERAYLRKCLEKIIAVIKEYTNDASLTIERHIRIKLAEPFSRISVNILVSGDSGSDIFRRNSDISHRMLAHQSEKLWSMGVEYDRVCQALDGSSVYPRDVYLLNERSPLGERLRIHPLYVNFEPTEHSLVDIVEQFEWSTLSEFTLRSKFRLTHPFNEEDFTRQLNDFTAMLGNRLALLRNFTSDVSVGVSSLSLYDDSMMSSQCMDEELEALLSR